MASMENLDVQTSTYLIANQSVELPDQDPHASSWIIAKEWTNKVLGIINSLNYSPQIIFNMQTEIKRCYYKSLSFRTVQDCFVYQAISLDRMVNLAMLESQLARLFQKLFKPLSSHQIYDSDIKLLHKVKSVEIWQPWCNDDIDDEFNADSIVLLNKADISSAVHNFKVLLQELDSVHNKLLALSIPVRSAA